MEQTVAKYRIDSPKEIVIRHIQPSDIRPVGDILRAEGCPASENLFANTELGIALDDIQKRKAKRTHTSPLASADMLLCVDGKNILFADAKFNSKTVKNIDKGEIEDKRRCSNDMLEITDYRVLSEFYILFSKSVLTKQGLSFLKRNFPSPNIRFRTAQEFYDLFEHK